MAPSVKLQAARVRPGRTEALFRLPDEDTSFQPGRNGRRFLVYEPEGAPQYRPMVVVENWAARLGRQCVIARPISTTPNFRMADDPTPMIEIPR
jgi:hypothetical protein